MKKFLFLMLVLLGCFFVSVYSYASEKSRCKKSVDDFFSALMKNDYAAAYKLTTNYAKYDAELLDSEIKSNVDGFAGQFKGLAYYTSSFMGLDRGLRVGDPGYKKSIIYSGVSNVEVVELKVFDKGDFKKARALVIINYARGRGPIRIDKVDVRFTANRNVVITPIKPIPVYSQTVFSSNHHFPRNPGKFNGYNIFFPKGKKIALSLKGIVTLVKNKSLGNTWLIEDFPSTFAIRDFKWRSN